MRLFEIFYMDLLELIINSGLGCNIYKCRAVCPAYADDIAIIAPFLATLQAIINRVYTIARRWRIDFNVNKCVTIFFPMTKLNEPTLCMVTICDEVIPQSNQHSHLGVGLGNEEEIVDCIVD